MDVTVGTASWVAVVTGAGSFGAKHLEICLASALIQSALSRPSRNSDVRFVILGYEQQRESGHARETQMA